MNPRLVALRTWTLDTLLQAARPQLKTTATAKQPQKQKAKKLAITLHAIDARHVRVRDTGHWPAHVSGRWCDHCCHAFEGPPIPLPVSWDSRTDIFKVQGMFCSFACAKGYNRDRARYTSGLVAELITLLQKRATGILHSVHAAPPRTALTVFGGYMSIAEFRQASKDNVRVYSLPPKMLPLTHMLEDHRGPEKRTLVEPRIVKVKDKKFQQTVDFSAAELPRNETLRLKRPKPLQGSKNVLARTMGSSGAQPPSFFFTAGSSEANTQGH